MCLNFRRRPQYIFSFIQSKRVLKARRYSELYFYIFGVGLIIYFTSRVTWLCIALNENIIHTIQGLLYRKGEESSTSPPLE